MDSMPILVLQNGIKIANFSSPHPFTFVTGEVLPPCSDERANGLALETEEKKTAHGAWVDINLTWKMSDSVHRALQDAVIRQENGELDVCLVPLPVMSCLREQYSLEALRGLPFRVIRKQDRITNAIYTDRFCL